MVGVYQDVQVLQRTEVPWTLLKGLRWSPREQSRWSQFRHLAPTAALL